MNNEFESQKKSRTFHKKSESGDIIEARKSMQNYHNGKKLPETFKNENLDRNSPHKRIVSDTILLKSKNKALNFINSHKNLEDDKNPFTFSYSKNALKKSANASMQNLINTATTFPQNTQFSNTLNREKNKSISLKDKFNLKATHFMNFIVNFPIIIELRP